MSTDHDTITCIAIDHSRNLHGILQLSDGREVRLTQDAWNSNAADGQPAWFAHGYLTTENPDDETGPTVTVQWESLGAEESEDDAEWDAPVSIKHYALGELLA